MSVHERPHLRPILAEDLDAVGGFLHQHLNKRLSPTLWKKSIVPPWPHCAPNHGFQLTVGDEVVGVQLAFYASRWIDGIERRFCNLAAWCVLEEYRGDGLRLLRAVLAQPGYEFTDLSPSGNVVALNERLRFRHLDAATVLVPALPWRRQGVSVSSDPSLIAKTLGGHDAELYRDHADAMAVIHVLLTDGEDSTYVAVRRERRKGLAIFGSFLYAGNPGLLHRAFRPLASHLLLHHGIAALLADTHIVDSAPRLSVPLSHARPKMLRSDLGDDAQIDYLYSELACVAW